MNFAKDSIEKGNSHSIVIYGCKKTSKKYVMAEMVEKLKSWVMEKID